MPVPDAITPDPLAKLVGTPRCPTILDVRRDALREVGPRLLPGARTVAEADLAPAEVTAVAALHDPFCRWCRDATGETHNRPTNRPGGAA